MPRRNPFSCARVGPALVFLLVACASRREPEPEVPDLISEADVEEQFSDVAYSTIAMFHTAISQAEAVHHRQRTAPCAVAWRHLQALMAAGRPTPTESARFYEVCGCCFTPEEDADEAEASAR